MVMDYDTYTVRELRELIWKRGLMPKRWMLNYVKKKEAVTILSSFNTVNEVPEKYLETIKKRNSVHRKKVYRSRKSRQDKFGTALTREERLKYIVNTAERLVFKEKRDLADGFTSYLGSTRGKIAFVFEDANNAEYLFTKSEVQSLSSMGLYIPRGIMNAGPTPHKETTKKRLKDIFGEG